jgi:hypothetical protein
MLEDGTTITLEDAISALKPDTGVNAQTSFHPFPRFPSQVRLYVWRLVMKALPGGIIPVTAIYQQVWQGEGTQLHCLHPASPHLIDRQP